MGNQITQEETIKETQEQKKEHKGKIKEKEKGGKTNEEGKEKVSRFFSDVTRNKINIDKRKNELRKRKSLNKNKNEMEQECKLFFRLLNVDGLNDRKLTIIK